MRFLVTASGGDISQAITRILRASFRDSFIVGTDLNEEPFAKNLVDQFLRLPLATSENYISEVARILAELEIDIFIPVSEAEIKVVANSLTPLSAEVLNIPKLAVDTFLDKFKTFEFLSKFGDYVPKSQLDFDEKYLGFPCLIKPRSGRGSGNVHICNNKSELEFYSERIENPIYQEVLQPQHMEITCGVYRSTLGSTQVIQLHRKLSGGRTSWAKVVYDDKIDGLCKRIAEEINLIGSINVQLINTDWGPKVFEINPRYSSTVEMRHLLGFKDLVWRINEISLDLEPELFRPKIGTIVGKVDSPLLFSSLESE